MKGGLLLALALAAVSSAAAAQVPPGAPYAGRTITAVRLEEDGRELTEAGLRSLVGRPLSLVGVRDSIVQLLGLGRFEDVQVDASIDGDGVALTFRLVPLRAVTGVGFRGDLGLSSGRLKRAVEDRFSGPPPIGRAAAAADVLLELYAGYGYMRARVAPSVRTEDRETRMVFEVQAGPRAPVGAIEIEGHPRLTEAQLLDRLDVRRGEYYDRARLEERLADYVADLRTRGFYEAAASHAVTLDRDGAALELQLNVEAGPFVTVRFEGDPIPLEQQRELVPVAREREDPVFRADEDLVAPFLDGHQLAGQLPRYLLCGLSPGHIAKDALHL